MIIPGVLVAIPFIFIKSMKEVAFTSAIGAIATLGVVLIVLISSFQYRPAGPIYHHDVIWDQFPIALSSIAFSYGGNMVYPNVERSMKHPQQWNKAVVLGLSSCSVMYISHGCSGVLHLWHHSPVTNLQ